MVKAELGDAAAQQLLQALAAADAEPETSLAAKDVDPPYIEPTNEGSGTMQ